MILDSEEQRELHNLSFEPQGDGFLYYQHRWSKGIPVTAEEREAYLNIPIFGSRNAWRQSLTGRQLAPPRSAWPVQKKMLAHMPLSFVVAAVGAGAVFIKRSNAASTTFIKFGYIIGGGMALIFAITIVAAKIANGKK
jgi:hypothetical protein